jgi:hypothetical protein
MALLLVLAGCGGDSESPKGSGAEEPSSGGASSTVPSVRTPEEKVCERLDRAAIADLLETSEKTLQLTDQVIGDEYRDPAGDPVPDADRNEATYCDVAEISAEGSAGFFRVSFASAEDSAQQLETYASQEDKTLTALEESGVSCEKVTDSGFGDPAWGHHCDGEAASLAVSGAFGPTVVTCSARTSSGKLQMATKVEPATAICLDVVKAVAS